jgi:hypothetical protein
MASGVIWILYLALNGILMDQTTGGGISLTPWALLSIYPFLTGSYVLLDGPMYVPMAMASLCLFTAVIMGAVMKKEDNGNGIGGRSTSVIFLLTVPLISLMISVVLMNIYGQRYFLILSPVIFYLAIIPLAGKKVQRIRNILLIIVILTSVMALPVQYTQTEKNDWRGVVSYIEENGESNDMVIPVPFWEGRSLEYYGPDLEIVFGKDGNDLDEKLEGHDKIWVVIKELKDDGWTKDHIESGFGAPSVEKDFTGLTLYLFER